MRIASVEAVPKAGIFKFLAPRAFSPKDSSSQRSPKSKRRKHITTELNLWTWTQRGWESLVLISLTSLPPTSPYPFPSYWTVRKMFVWDKQILSQWKNYHTTKNEWTGSFFLCLSFCVSKYFYNASYSFWIGEDPDDLNQGYFWDSQDFCGSPWWLNFAPEITVQAVDIWQHGNLVSG